MNGAWPRFSGDGVVMAARTPYTRPVLVRRSNRLPSVRGVAVSLLVAAGVAVAALSVTLLDRIPVGNGSSPWSALGLRWALQDTSVFAVMSAATGLALGGWKAVSIARGTPTSRTSAVVWLGLFAAFTIGAVGETVWTVHALGWPV